MSETRNSVLLPYYGGLGTWFVTFGLHSVLVPTLAAIHLQASAGTLGTLQMLLSLPQLLFLMYAGSVADRSNARVLLVLVNILAALPPMGILLLLWFDAVTFWSLLIYGFCFGTCLAFASPARDALLMRVVDRNIQKYVMGALITQNLSQLSGYALAALAAPLAGVWALPIMQLVALIVGLGFALRLPSYPPLAQKSDDGKRLDWASGLRVVFASGKLWPVLLANTAVGILFIGVFMVSMPLIARDIFGGGQFEISIMSLCFWGGTIFSTAYLMRRAPIHHRGRAFTLAIPMGALFMMLMMYAPSFAVFCAFNACWGIAAGVNMAMGRTIMQVESPEHSRARVMALYNLGFIGAAPLGAIFIGLLSDAFGVREAPVISAYIMFAFTLWFAIATPIWRVTRHPDEV